MLLGFKFEKGFGKSVSRNQVGGICFRLNKYQNWHS